MQDLRDRLWTILEREGKTLAALNATLFAGKLSDTLARRAVDAQRDLAERILRNWSLAKGVLVGLNPVPISDLSTDAREQDPMFSPDGESIVYGAQPIDSTGKLVPTQALWVASVDDPSDRQKISVDDPDFWAVPAWSGR